MTSRNPTTSRHDIERFLRVDHAGERAAQQIYKGQLAVLANHEMAHEIRHMMDQEVEHLETFDSLLNKRQVRPSCSTAMSRCSSSSSRNLSTVACSPPSSSP